MSWFLLTVLAVFFVVVEAIYEKKTLTRTRSFEFAMMFALANVLLLAPFSFWGDTTQIDAFVLGMIFLASIPSAVGSFLVFKTIKHNQLSESAPLIALLPLVVTVLAFFILGEKMTSVHLIGLLLIVGGMMVLELRNFKFKGGIFVAGRKKYIVYILLLLLFGGVSSLFDRVILFQYGVDPLAYLTLIQIFIALNFLFFFLIRRNSFRAFGSSIRQSWKIVLFISALTVAHRYVYALAIALASSLGIVVAVYRLSSLFHVFSGGKFFAEDGILRKSIASIIILGGTVLLVIK